VLFWVFLVVIVILVIMVLLNRPTFMGSPG